MRGSSKTARSAFLEEYNAKVKVYYKDLEWHNNEYKKNHK